MRPHHRRKSATEAHRGGFNSPARRWIKQIVADFDLESFHFRLLVKAADAWDRSEQAREQIATDGITVPDRYGVLKAHRAVAIERDSRLAFARLLRELALDAAAPDSRPPRTQTMGTAADAGSQAER